MTLDELFAQAVQSHQAGHLADAEALYQQILRSVPDHAPAIANLGVLAMRQGRPDAAIVLYERAIRLTPNSPDHYFNLGNAYRKLNRFSEAAENYQQTLKRNPTHSGALYNLGLVLSQVGMYDPARECFEQTLKIQPNLVDAANHLGDVLQKLGRYDEAIALFRQLIEQRPDYHRAYNNLALALSQTGQHEMALNVITRVIQRQFDYVEALNTHGVILEALGRPDEALPSYERAVQLRPTFAEGYNNVGIAYTELGRHDEAIAARRKAIELDPNRASVHSNLLLALHYPDDIAPESLFAEHRAWAKVHAEPLRSRIQPITRDRNPDRVLKIGMVSPDFRSHTVANFLEPIVSELDRTQFELTLYAQVGRSDEVTQRFQKLCSRFHNTARIHDDAFAELIRSHQIDILIDYAGHTANNRLLTFARKPAPIQMTHFGYPDTTGMDTIDYRITDAISEPPGTTEAFSTEQLIRMPESAWCWQPPIDAPEVNPLPAITNKHLTFGVLNNPAKLNETMITLWADLLTTIPTSKLIMLAGRAGFGGDLILERFAKHGISAERIRIVPRQSPADYLKLHHEIDIALDPFPYHGGITSCDALWMGVPVLTLAGKTYVSRQGVMLMTLLDLPDFIAQFPDQLIGLAYRWAEDLSGLAKIRASLRERLRATSLVDAPRYVRQLEGVYRDIWKAFCQRN